MKERINTSQHLSALSSVSTELLSSAHTSAPLSGDGKQLSPSAQASQAISNQLSLSKHNLHVVPSTTPIEQNSSSAQATCTCTMATRTQLPLSAHRSGSLPTEEQHSSLACILTPLLSIREQFSPSVGTFISLTDHKRSTLTLGRHFTTLISYD